MVEEKDPARVERGVKAKRNGTAFEFRVRNDLEIKGWNVNKWSNNIFDNKIKFSRHIWKGPNRPMTFGTGFPDFCCHFINEIAVDVIGVESKSNGNLSKEEKEKCRWYIKRNVFSKILIAKKTKIKNKVAVEYDDFEDRYGTR